MRLQLTRSGRLLVPPQVIGTSGVDDENARYEERVKDLAVATFTGCAPLVSFRRNFTKPKAVADGPISS